MNSNQQYLMGCPSMEKQLTCCVCGKPRESMHHVVPRSLGGHDGPQLPLCGSGTTGCHGRTEGEGEPIYFTHDVLLGWMWSDRYTQWTKCRTDDEWLILDQPPTYDEDDSLAELLEMGGKVDYLIGRALIDKLKAYKGDRKALGEWLCESFDFNPKSINSYITKRISYASLEHPGIERVGITAGYKIARIVATGVPVADVMRDYTTMSKAQFNEQYGGGAKARRTCPKCGCEL